MNERFLVTYASGLGSTAEVSAEICQTLSAGGCAVDLRPVGENPSPQDYQAVVIGSAVRHGNWLAEAVEYVRANRAALAQVPVALFSVHITCLGNDETSRQVRLGFLDAVRPLVNPVEAAYFAGKFDRRGAALLIPGLFARFIPTLDFRKWDLIRAWAAGLPVRLCQAVNSY